MIGTKRNSNLGMKYVANDIGTVIHKKPKIKKPVSACPNSAKKPSDASAAVQKMNAARMMTVRCCRKN